MMKAKEYASRFNEKMTEDEFGKVLYDTLLDFLKEGQILIDSRGNSSNSVSGVLREMDMKWQALAGRIPGPGLYQATPAFCKSTHFQRTRRWS